MARQGYLQNVRKAGAFADGQLKAGEWGLDVTNGDWYFSRNGTTVELFEAGTGGGGATNLNDLTDVQIAALASGQILYYNGTTWVNAAPATAGVVPTSQKGAADGVATLDSGGKIPTAQLPALAVTSVSVVANNTARDALTVQAGDVAIVTGTGETFIYDGAAWQEIKATEAHTHSAADITSGDLAAARMQTNVVAALNAAPTGTISNANLTWDCGTL